MTRSIKDWQEKINAWAIRKEWRGPNATPRPLGIDLMLWVTEVAEAFECLRITDEPLAEWRSYSVVKDEVKFENLTYGQLGVLLDCDSYSELDALIEELGLIPKPEGWAWETADLLIRIFETCEEHGVDIEPYVEAKMKYNETRELRHGGKLM